MTSIVRVKRYGLRAQPCLLRVLWDNPSQVLSRRGTWNWGSLYKGLIAAGKSSGMFEKLGNRYVGPFGCVCFQIVNGVLNFLELLVLGR